MSKYIAIFNIPDENEIYKGRPAIMLSHSADTEVVTMTVATEVKPFIATMPDQYGKEHFRGICPYTDKKCDTWTCGICEVAERERKFMEGDTD